MTTATCSHGWVRRDGHDPLGAFWLDVPARAADVHDRPRHVRQIYDTGEIPPVEWVNVTHDCAAVLAADGGWRDGAHLHLWISPGAGKTPYEVSELELPTIHAGDEHWITTANAAATRVEEFLGLA